MEAIMTVGTHLSSTASSLVLSSSELQSIRTSTATLSTRLSNWFGNDVKHSFQFGSSIRGTILPRSVDSNSDIDFMVVFDTSTETKKPQTYLDRLRRFIDNKYSTSEVKQSHPTVVLSLNHISFELVPAIDSYGYQIPSPSSSFMDWMPTDPNASNTEIQDKNTSNHSHIKPLVRLIKYWNANNGFPYQSYSLEQYIVQQYYWPNNTLKDLFYQFWAGFNSNYNDAQRTKDKVQLAKNRAANAAAHEQQGSPYSAEAEIKKIIPAL